MANTETKIHRIEDRLESLEETIVSAYRNRLEAIQRSLDDINAGR